MTGKYDFSVCKGRINAGGSFSAAQKPEAVGGVCGPLNLSREFLADKLDSLCAHNHACAIRMFAPESRLQVDIDGPVMLGDAEVKP